MLSRQKGILRKPPVDIPSVCHVVSAARHKADIRLRNYFSNTHDKNWINVTEGTISIQSNKPINYYCTDLYWGCVICIGAVTFVLVLCHLYWCCVICIGAASFVLVLRHL
jgi:hypothetical protein